MGRTIIAATILLLLITTGCNNNKVYYYTYDHTPIAGWEKNDGMEFDIPTLPTSGTYGLALGMRLSDDYPFRNLNMVIKQTIYHNDSTKASTITDTITCNVVDRQGSMKGSGVALYQYDLPLRKAFYHSGDSIHITVRHNMKREVLPGIADVGIQLKAY